MIRDWRLINKDNVNTIIPNHGGRVGRTWIATCSNDCDLEGMNYIMQLKPDMSGRCLPVFPFALLSFPKCLRIYIENGGSFKDIFNEMFITSELHHLHKTESVRLLFEKGTRPPNFTNPNLPLWVKKVYQEVERRRENCRAACVIFCAMCRWPKTRSSLFNRGQRDVLGIIIQNVWQGRTREEWEI